MRRVRLCHAGRPMMAERLSDLRDAGEFKTIAARYGVPDHPPFDETYSLRALNELKKNLEDKNDE